MICMVDELLKRRLLGPMVYSTFYLPRSQERSLLATTHQFNDSKTLTTETRSSLMRKLCMSTSDLYQICGWAVKVMSARDISAGMLRASGSYNLNAQAMDATIELIRGVLAQGVNVKEMYIDTIGSPQSYQNKLSRLFPAMAITVAKKADSLYPCVSAASVCAKVTRDLALDVCYRGLTTSSYSIISQHGDNDDAHHLEEGKKEGWGSGYPSDARCSNWLKRNMDPVFGWGHQCRFSWSTAKDMLEGVNNNNNNNMADASSQLVKVNWRDDLDQARGIASFDDYFATPSSSSAVNTSSSLQVGGDHGTNGHEMLAWFGTVLTENVF